MEKFTTKPSQRLIALLLCLAMLIPSFAVPGYATEAEESAAEQTPVETTQLESEVPVDDASGTGTGELETELLVEDVMQNKEAAKPTWPTYTGGYVSDKLESDCGNGIGGNDYKSYITVVTNTTATHFNNYLTKLINNGYKGTNWNDGSNYFGSYISADGSHKLYTYYLGYYRETRIIVDTNPDTINGYSYTPGKTVTTPKMVMWGLSTSYTGYHIDYGGGTNTDRCVGMENNGSLVIIRMKDNSLFFHDGGSLAQMNDQESAELLAFCRELTGTTAGEKMVINTWFVSHAHDDHFEAFGRFININHDHFDLKNVVYNIDLERGRADEMSGAAKATTPPSKKLREALDIVTKYYPDAKYYNPHTGEKFNVAGVEFEVLYTHEDRLLPNSYGELSFHTDTLDGNGRNIVDKGGTYRTGNDSVYKSTDVTDFNDTSTVIRITFENGVSSILYGDLNLAEKIVLNVQSAAKLQTDIMQIPHHLFDDHTKLVQKAQARVYLIMQSKAPVYGPDNNYTTNDTGTRVDLCTNFTNMKNAMDGTEGVNYDIFWGGSETVVIDIEALGQKLGKSAASKAAVTGSYYTTEKANSFKYADWTMTTPAAAQYQSVINSTDNPVTASDAVTVDTNQIVFVPVTGTLKQGGKYILMNDHYGHILSFDATAEPDVYPPSTQQGSRYGQSITRDSDGDSENTYYMDGKNVILDHSDRHFAIWNLYQYPCANKHNNLAAIPDGGNLDILKWSNFGPTVKENGTIYEGTELQKLTDVDDPYWQALSYGNNTGSQDYQLRYLCTRSNTTPFKNYYQNSQQKTSDSDKNKYIIELLEDGTYVVYFKMNDEDFRFLSCSADGVWSVVQYTGSNAKANAKADYDKLKLRLYEYQETNESKTVAFSGDQTYYVDKGVAVDSILSDISTCITVYDDDHKKQQIPYNNSEITRTNFGGTEVKITAKKEGYYWLDGSAVKTDAVGEYSVAIKYHCDNGEDVTIGRVYVMVGKHNVSIENKSGVVMKNSGLGAHVERIEGETSEHAVFTFDGETKKITVGMLTDAKGRMISTATPGTYDNLTLTYKGTVICEDYTLEVLDSNEVLDYPVYPEEGSVTVDKGTTTTEDAFSTTGAANIELSATAVPLHKGVDIIIIMDLSSSMRYHVNNALDACGPKYNTDGTLNKQTTSQFSTEQDQKTHVYNEEWWKNTRMYALEESLKEMVISLQSSNTDVRIAMADFGDLDHYEIQGSVLDKTIGDPSGAKPYLDGNKSVSGQLESEMSNHLNFILGANDPNQTYEASGGKLSQPFYLDRGKYDPTYKAYKDANGQPERGYTGKVLPYIYTGDHTLSASAFQNVKTLDTTAMAGIIEQMRIMNGKRLGTNYDIGLETAYRLAYARQQENIANGEDREIICIFMSDGAAMQYNYLSGRSHSEAWSQCIIGETDEILTNNADKYVITSDYADTSVKQNPYLQEMLMRLADLLKPVNDNGVIRSSLHVPGTTDQYYPACYSNSTDFFVMMDSIGVDCDWELLWQIAYTNYTFAETHDNYYNALKLTSLTGEQNFAKNDKFCENTLGAVTASLRAPSYKADGTQYEYQTLSPYYYFYNAEGKNWWAEALKGDTNQLYPVVSKFAIEDSTEWGDVDFYYGDVRNNFSDPVTTKDQKGNDLALAGKNYIAGFRGLGIELYTVGFGLGTERRIDYTETAKVLENVATGPAYHYEAVSGESLTAVLTSIAATSTSSAKRAYYVDTMGPNFDLSTEKTVVNEKGQEVTVNAKPQIRVLEYTLDKTKPVKDENGVIVGYERKKDAEGNYVVAVKGVIAFEAGQFTDVPGTTATYQPSGTLVAYSDQIYTLKEDGTKIYTDIWDDETNMIVGKNLHYNANKDKSVALTLDDTGRTFSLPAESFFWIIGTLGETEMVLEYQVYLEGSLEDKLSHFKTYYDTNKSAILYYVNHLGNDCHLDTVTPKFPWGDGVSLSAEFYLVDENGNPLTGTGTTTEFNGSMKLGNEQFAQVKPGETTLDASELLTTAGLNTDLYELYDPSSEFTLTYDQTNSGGTKWDITVGSDKKETTYVTNYGKDKDPTTATTSTGLSGVDYDDMKVYFAVRYKQKATADVIVIDFGLPVKINVLGNDTYSNGKATVLGIKTGNTVVSNPFDAPTGYVNKTGGTYGDIELITAEGDDKYRIMYTPKTMNMKAAEVFTYAAQETDTGYYYYATVTVIPAANIYYEDSFLSFKDSDIAKTTEGTNGEWAAVTSGYNGSGIQAEDRPGEDVNNALGSLDADNVYGYDAAYQNCTMYSLGSAMKVTVDATTGNYASKPVPKDAEGNTLDIWGYRIDKDGNRLDANGDNVVDAKDKQKIVKYEQTVSGDHPTATFTFTGTGFDVVGLTDSTSGGLIVEVRRENDTGAIVKDHVVNTYYGYQYVKNEETGAMEWVVIQNPTDEQRAELCLYQVPVMKIENLDYGTYHVTIRAVYMSSMDMDLGKDEDGNWLTNGSYTVWLDAIRIYNPAQEDDTSNDAYEQDGENNPHYITIKDLLVKADSFADGNAQNGIVYVDGKAEGVTIKDYENQGPNNETYLMHFSGIAFKLRYNGDSEPDVNIHLGAKLAKGSYATLNYNSALLVPSLSTATNMFYKLTPTWTKNAETGYWEMLVILQSYGSDAITSLTDLKITGADAGSIVGNPAGDTEPALMIVVDDEVVEAAKLYMSADGNDDTTTGGDNTTGGDKPEDETTKPTDKVEDETTKPTEKVEDETTKPTTKPSGGSNKPAQDGSNAATGDNMMVFVMLMMFSVMGMAAMTVLARKKEEM